MKIPKVKIVKKKLDGRNLGLTHFKQGGNILKDRAKPHKVEIDVKAHKGDKLELASTIKHELMHVKHPKMTEKQVYKATSKGTINPVEQKQLLSLLKNRQEYKPGSLISKMNENKRSNIKSNNNNLSKQEIAIRGLV